ncbi:MAG: endonuclease/exonuclease/phosphatase family protein [Bacteroidota bacterium]
MRQLLIFPMLCLLLSIACQPTLPPAPQRLKVVAWNILHGANDYEDGPEAVIDILEMLAPDVVLMVETYGSGPRIADSLGMNFHLIASEGTPLGDSSVNLSIYSRYPFGESIDTDHPFYLGGREILVGEQKVRMFSNWFHYLPWENQPETLGMSAEELLAWEQVGKRNEMVQQVLPTMRTYAAEADSIPVIIGGDFNSPSHMDWGETTKEQHNGLVVPWSATKVLEDIGLIDSYREIHPDPLTHPGITWDQPEKTDEHRIDYIFYSGQALQAVSSESYMAFVGDTLRLPDQSLFYPSDHGIVVTTFELGKP